MGKTILITGGLGFIGYNFIRYFYQAHPGDRIVNLDKITYSTNPENLRDLDKVITDDV
jgi:dTDP-glucose 4,6-dehydratase